MEITKEWLLDKGFTESKYSFSSKIDYSKDELTIHIRPQNYESRFTFCTNPEYDDHVVLQSTRDVEDLYRILNDGKIL